MTEKTERNKASSEVVRQSDLALLTDVQAVPSAGKASCPFPDGDFSAGTGSDVCYLGMEQS